MRILYVGTDELLDWSRRKVLASAGYLVMDVRDLAQAAEALGKGARLAILSNLVPEAERKGVASFLALRHPDVLRMAFDTQTILWRASHCRDISIPTNF